MHGMWMVFYEMFNDFDGMFQGIQETHGFLEPSAEN